MRCSRVVILGTGTGAGKTWVTRGLARALRSEGAHVVALKPIESGVPPEGTTVSDAGTDAELLASASSAPPKPAPYRFGPPISPHLAARQALTEIDLTSVVDYIRRHESDMTSHAMSFVLVESAGGCFTPLRDGVTNLELARALEPAIWVLVAPDALGVLHDVTVALIALRARARAPDYVVLSQARERDASTGTNAAELATLGIVRPIAVLERGDEESAALLARALIERHVASDGAGSRS